MVSSICNVHMANKAHKPFLNETPELKTFLTKLHDFGFAGPITLELGHGTVIKEIARSKALFQKLLKEF